MILLLCTLAFADLDASYELSLRNETRFRQADLADPIARGLAVDVEFQPIASVKLDWGTWRISASYFPRFVFPEFGSGEEWEPLQQGQAEIGWKPSSRFELIANESASYGTYDYTSLVSATSLVNQTVQPLPTAEHIQQVSSYSTLLANADVAERTFLSLNGVYLYSGGLREADRTALPLQFGPSAGADVQYKLDPMNRLSTRVNGTLNDFSTGAAIDYAQGEERWLLQLSTEGELEIAAGGYAARVLAPGARELTEGRPTGRIAGSKIWHAWHGEVTVRLGAWVQPFVDRIVVALYDRAELNANVVWNYEQVFFARLQASWAVAVWDSRYQGQQILFTEPQVAVRPLKYLELNAGVRLYLQSPTVVISHADVENGGQWVAYVGALLKYGSHF